MDGGFKIILEVTQLFLNTQATMMNIKQYRVSNLGLGCQLSIISIRVDISARLLRISSGIFITTFNKLY